MHLATDRRIGMSIAEIGIRASRLSRTSLFGAGETWVRSTSGTGSRSPDTSSVRPHIASHNGQVRRAATPFAVIASPSRPGRRRSGGTPGPVGDLANPRPALRQHQPPEALEPRQPEPVEERPPRQAGLDREPGARGGPPGPATPYRTMNEQEGNVKAYSVPGSSIRRPQGRIEAWQQARPLRNGAMADGGLRDPAREKTRQIRFAGHDPRRISAQSDDPKLASGRPVRSPDDARRPPPSAR